jgi:hypothetical protein
MTASASPAFNCSNSAWDPTAPPAKWKIASGSAVSIILASRVEHQGASPIAI